MSHQKDPIANRSRVLSSRAIILLALSGLVFTFALASTVAAIKTAKYEEASAKTVVASESEREAALARLFTDDTVGIGKVGNYAGPNLSMPAPQGTPTQVKINFDDIPPLTNIANQYPKVTFSSPGLFVYSWTETYATSPPHAATRGIIDNAGIHNYHSADFVATFHQPVNDLKFYITACDNFGTIARLDIYQNNVLTQPNIPVPGGGASHPPIPFNAQSAGFNNITKIVIHSITDLQGLTYDDFSFTIPAPPSTPTPSASPTPPQAPSLQGVPDEEAANLTWSASTGATHYLVKRTGSNCTTDANTTAMTAGKAAVAEEVAAAFLVPINGTSFADSNLCSNATYNYTVTAVGVGGESQPSNEVSLTALPKPGCDASFRNPPIPVGSFNATGGYGWVMNYRFSADSGMELNNISLYGRLMAEWISAPYFVLRARSGSGSQQSYGLLRANGSNADGSLRSRLVDFKLAPPNNNKLLLEATYQIDRIPGAPKACLKVTQSYEFYAPGIGVPTGFGPPSSNLVGCEPSATVPCAKFRPMTKYEFQGRLGESLDWINIPQRLHYQVKGETTNTVGMFTDCDTKTCSLMNKLSVFSAVRNPLKKEFWSSVIGPTQASAGPPHREVRFDNFHQTNNKEVSHPTVTGLPGCPECAHNHWRWSALAGAEWGGGRPLTMSNNQTVDIGVVRYPGKTAPGQHWVSLVQGKSLRVVTVDRCRTCIPRLVDSVGIDPVLWFSPTGYNPSDTFFYHTAWFNPRPQDAQTHISIESGNESSAALMATSGDGPVSVDFGDVYVPGTTTFNNTNLGSLPPLPAGYAALNNTGYSIETTAVVSGPHLINFTAGSVTDATAFDRLRIFHLEHDPFDPDEEVWAETTILSPDTPAPDFGAKTLSAKSHELGVFVIGTEVGPIPNDVADIAVSCSASANPIVAGNQLTYTVQVTNHGPQMAHEVKLSNGLSPDVVLESATSANGTCKEVDGTVFCKLNSLAVGATASVAIVVIPTEGTGSFPAEGKSIYNGVVAKANEGDGNIENNSAEATTLALPNPNKAPMVSITSPQNGALFVGPTNITVNSTATDSDGTISKVEIFDNGELSGQATPTGNNQYVFTKQNAAFGVHSLLAIATDNNGRQNISAAVDVIVNGAANVSITSPAAGALIAPGSNVTLTASATHPSGTISKVEFFANGQLLGAGNASGSQYFMAWNNLSHGAYTLVAVATDGSGITTTSLPINFKVGSPPTVAMTTPFDGTTFPSATNISVSATASSPTGSIARIDFYANGTLIGTASDIGTDKFTVTWRQPADGLYSVHAVATDNLGLTTTSAAITIGVNTPSPRPGEFIWFDDALPPGAVKHADGDVDWYWVDKNPVAISGNLSHQSRNFGQLEAPNSFHQHYFDGATQGLTVNPGDRLFTYVFLDINNMPREIMLQFKDASGWEHRVYWGENRIELGTNYSWSRFYRGPLPKANTWVRLEIPAFLVGLEGSTVTGMAFTLDGGRATWDLVGKVTSNTPQEQPPPVNDFIWVDDAVPAGATLETFNDQWQWLDPHVCGTKGHRSFFTQNQGAGQMRWHAFRGASNPMNVLPGDVLFQYVYLDGNNMPDQIMLQWHDGSSWEHRAFWGENYIGQKHPTLGVQGTESQRYMGGLPPANRWVRLEIPASYVGLEGKRVSGMSFGFYSSRDHAGINWDCSGKAGRLTTVPLLMTPTTGVWRLYSNTFGWSFNTNDQGEPAHVPQKKNAFFAYPNKAAGTVPMYRFKRPSSDNHEYFYAQCLECYDGNGWNVDGIAFYVFPSPTPNAIPLYLYHDHRTKYFLTTDPNEAAGMTLDQIWGYVPNITPIPPAAPTFLIYQNCYLGWRDNSWNEVGFKVERFDVVVQGNQPPVGVWTQIGTPITNAVWFKIGCQAPPGPYRVRAYNSFGDSAYSNEICKDCYYLDSDPGNSLPETIITSHQNGAVVNGASAIVANASDSDGNGTVALVEFFANGVKLAEDSQPPYVFPTSNMALGSYSFTTVVTDSTGATATSAPVNVTLSRYAQEINFNWIPDHMYGDAPFALSAEASSGLPVTFTVVSGPASVSGNTLTITGTGSVTVRASQPGDASYNAAANVDRTFNVSGASATITLSNLNQTYDGSPKPVTATTNPAGLTGVSITYDGSPTAPTNAGSYAIVASLTNPHYTAANATGTLTIAKASQTISFTAPSDKTYGDAPFGLSASSSSNLAVSLSIVSGPATLSGNTLTITGAGSVTVRASQTGNTNYNAAANVDRTFNVAKASATISLSNLSHVYDGTVKNATATTNPAGLSGVAISYSGPALTPINAGSYSVVATLINANYTAPNATATLTVAKANPVLTWQNPDDITIGTALSATQLNATANAEGTFAYSPPAGTVLNVGSNQTLSATFTPTISANYNTVSTTVRINVIIALLLNDDFNDNSLDSSKWTIVYPQSPVVVTEQGQQLRITVPPNTSSYNGIVSNSAYDLRGSTVEVELAQPISQAGWCENFIQVTLDSNNYFLVDAGAGSMVFRSMVGGSNDQTVLPTFDYGQQRHWRIRHDQGANTINFETSPDRLTWTLRKTAAVGFSLAAMKVHLYAGAWGTGNSNPGAAAFDNLRLFTNDTANSLPIANSGFELPVQPANGFQYAPAGPGWTFNGGSGVSANNSGFTAANPPAPELNQVAILQGGSTTWFSQPVAGFQANTNYVVTFSAAQRGNHSAGGQDFRVYLDSDLLGTFRPASLGYVYFSTPAFTTTAGTHTLKFVGLNSLGGDNTAFIDTVRIMQSNSPQPGALLSDDFNSTVLDATKWSGTDPSRVTDNGQQLQIALLPNTAAYHAAYSNSTYNLTGRSVQVELAQPISQAGWCENFVMAMLDWNNYLMIHSGAGSMVIRSMVNGANDQTVVPTFNPGVHHFWRIRHDQSSNTIKFETSPDTVNWTILKSAAVGFSLSSVRFYMYAGCWGTGNGNPGAAKFDNFRLLDLAYLGSPVTLPGTIEPENYDNGDAGLAYYDTTPGSHGQDYDQPNYPTPTFRLPTNVDMYKHTGYSGGYLVLLQAGDWMKYSVNVTQAGNYTLYARIAWGGTPGGTFHIEVDGIDKTGPIQTPDTGWSLQVITKTLQLPAGLHSVKVVADTNGANGSTGDIDYLYFRLNP